jgi:hypothetical protein
MYHSNYQIKGIRCKRKVKFWKCTLYKS